MGYSPYKCAFCPAIEDNGLDLHKWLDENKMNESAWDDYLYTEITTDDTHNICFDCLDKFKQYKDQEFDETDYCQCEFELERLKQETERITEIMKKLQKNDQ